MYGLPIGQTVRETGRQSLAVREQDLLKKVAKLLVHFYDVTGGAVKIGGQDVRDMSIEALNQEISYVVQEQFLLGRLDAADEEVLAAAEKAQCSDFLQKTGAWDPYQHGTARCHPGRIIQKGTHEELMAQPGRYRDFVTIREQSAGWSPGQSAAHL